jgi:hypothetical protein
MTKLIIWAGHVAHMEEKRIAYKVLARKSEENITLIRPRHAEEYDIKMDIKERRWEVAASG